MVTLHDRIAEVLGLPADAPDDDLVAEVERIAKRIRRADARAKEWYKENPETNRKACRQWRLENPEKVADINRKRREARAAAKAKREGA